MKNEKFNKVLDVVIKIISIVSILAQTLKTAFPVEQSPVNQQSVSQDDAHMIRDFLAQGVK